MKFTVALLAPLVWVAAWGQVTTQHNDIFRSGQNTNEVLLTPSNVNVNRFGKLVSVAMDGYVVAQPLYLPQVTVTGGTLHNVVFVATQHDSVFALDAESGNLLWSTSLIPRGGSTVPITVQGCGASTGYTEVGVMGTPVIDRSSNTLYVVAKTLENNSSVFRLHALDVGTGRERLGGPVVISASVMSGTTQVTFNPAKQLQRPGLLLANGNVYLAFGSNGCDIDATGWIMAYNAVTLQQVGVFNPDPDQTSGGSIWQSGKGVAADGVGNIYFATANGAFDVRIGDCGECVMKLGSSLTPSDYFSPADRDYLDTQDFDLGSGGVLLLPDQANPPHYLLVAAGKEGTVYLLNRNNLGQFNASGDQVVQELAGGLPQVDGGGTGAAYWNNNIYFASTKGLRMFRLSNGTLSAVSIPKSASAISGKGLPSVSANGTTNGIVWVLGGPTYLSPQLAAYDATQLASLYTSSAAANGRDALSPTAHFATPTIAKGRVYVGTQSQLVIYGLLPMLQVWFGNNQSGSAGTTLPNPIEVKAVDAYSGSVLPNITVTFSDNGTGGTFSNPTAITDSNGIALTTYTLPSTPGTVKISASAARFAGTQFTEVAVTSAGFDMVISNSALSAVDGRTAIFNGTLTALNGYNSNVNINCNGGSIPSSCAPASVAPSDGGQPFQIRVSNNTVANLSFNLHAVGTDPAAFTQTVPVTLAVAQDFIFTASSSTQTVTAGGAATYSLTVSPAGNAFSSSISFSCSGLPPLTQCLLPAPVTPGVNSVPVTLTIDTTTPIAILHRRKLIYAAWLPGFGITFLFGLLSGDSRRKRCAMYAAIGTVLLLTLLPPACGGGGGSGGGPQPQPGTLAGTYTVTVHASSGAQSHTLPLKLTVQ